MRILYHHRTLADGAEGVHIAAMVEAFRALGHEVRLTGPAAAEDRGGRRRMVERVRAVTPRGAFEMASVAFNVLDFIQTRKEIQQFRPDLLYKRHAKYDVAALAAARQMSVPTALEVNALFAGRRYRQFEPLAMPRVVQAFERRALELATLVIAVSSPLGRDVSALADANVVVLPNGADPQRFDPERADVQRIRAQHGLSGVFTIGWGGILREWHGLELLLNAMATLPSAALLIVGDGPARATLEQRVKEAALEGRTVITGRVAHADMPDYIAAMDVAVVPDERTGVASPMKLLEYMSMARAVVAPRAENITDLIEDGVDGLLFEPGNPRDLGGQLYRLATDANLRKALGARARGKIERDRNWRAIAQAVLAAAVDR